MKFKILNPDFLHILPHRTFTSPRYKSLGRHRLRTMSDTHHLIMLPDDLARIEMNITTIREELTPKFRYPIIFFG